MKHVFALGAALLLLAPTLFAQKTFKKAFTGSSPKVSIVIEKAEIEITGYSGNEIQIEAMGTFTGPPERAKGLKPLYNNAEDNTGIGLEIKEAGGVMTVKKASYQEATYKIKVPNNADVKVEILDWNKSDLDIKDISGEVELIGKSSDIKLVNVTGPIVSNTVNGNTEVIFSKVNQSKPCHISTINGFVDVTMPADTKAKLSMSTFHGEVYSDLDIKFATNEKTDKLKAITRNISGATLNGGGVEMTIKSINGDLYLRKK
ncbi:hypothetical protein [Haliscomenobacter hydrossis]|uniref:Adhesin domain-containing protein n=1 Tax=Haliscomenobacter hydrossis (strain ATCC 27775 / DSM 1100 / LMG 10767 / O) TaxID=760192 RepID=F4KZW1_HALH1|nr:hypothetical protein [Haliscomenobacter hydrossis]AEE51531.1 hypothetical protein Halhy_3679 [Haliscomenobacter hydrossis DSM 1100]